MGNHPSKKIKSNFHDLILRLKSNTKEDYDENEHLCHILLRDTFRGNFSSPIHNVLSDSNVKVLDVGCGSGFWVMEMAADYQKPKYCAIDLLPVFPKSTYPSNVEFRQCDFLKGLPFKDNTFDFVHMRYLVFEFTESHWENFVIQELTRVLKPGGWLEICDFEFGIVNCGPMTFKFDSTVMDLLRSKGVEPYIVRRYRNFIEKTPSLSPATIRHEKRESRFITSDGSRIGEINNIFLRQRVKFMLEGPVGQNLNIKKKNVSSTMDKIERECESNSSYYYIHRFYVQKEI